MPELPHISGRKAIKIFESLREKGTDLFFILINKGKEIKTIKSKSHQDTTVNAEKTAPVIFLLKYTIDKERLRSPLRKR